MGNAHLTERVHLILSRYIPPFAAQALNPAKIILRIIYDVFLQDSKR